MLMTFSSEAEKFGGKQIFKSPNRVKNCYYCYHGMKKAYRMQSVLKDR